MPEAIHPHPCRWLALLGIIGFFVAPALTTFELTSNDGQPGEYPGWPLLYFGWIEAMGILSGRIDGIGWLANPLFLLGTLRLLLGKQKSAIALLIAAALFSLTSFLLKEVLLDEAGHTSNVVGYKQGFWLWMAAIWLNLFIALLMQSFSMHSKRRQSESQ